MWSLQGVCFSVSLFSCVLLQAKADEDTPSEPYGLSTASGTALPRDRSSGSGLTQAGVLSCLGHESPEDAAMLHGDGCPNPSESLGTGNYIQVF